MSSAICFNLDQSKNLSSANGLTRYRCHEQQNFNDAPGKQAF